MADPIYTIADGFIEFIANNYGWLLLGYAVFFVWFYLVPLARWAVSSDWKNDLTRLKHGVAVQLTTEQKKLKPDAEARPKEKEEDDETDPSRRTIEVPAFDYKFESSFVREATNQIRTHFPHAQYQRFDLERLPAFGTYTERLTIARNMAGLFVLIGLLGTMALLNDVVFQIGDSARRIGADATEQVASPADSLDAAPAGRRVNQDAFLEMMSRELGGIGNAFTSSIIGLFFMISFLVVIALMDRRMQSQFSDIDETLTQQVIPDLVALERLKNPIVTPGDLLRQTDRQLVKLRDGVADLNQGMVDSLAKLSETIRMMLNDFGTIREHFVLFSDWVKQLNEATKALEKAAYEMEIAGRKSRNPIERFNKDLTEVLKNQTDAYNEHKNTFEKHVENEATYLERLTKTVEALKNVEEQQREFGDTTKEHLDVSRQGYLTIADHVNHLRKDQNRLLEEVKTRSEQGDKDITEQLKALLEKQEQGIDALSSILKKDVGEYVAEALTALRNQQGQWVDVVIKAMEAGNLETAVQQLTKSLSLQNDMLDRLGRSLKRQSSSARSKKDFLPPGSTGKPPGTARQQSGKDGWLQLPPMPSGRRKA